MANLTKEMQTELHRLELQRMENRHKQERYRTNSPDKRRANDLRYYARQLTAAGYTVVDPAGITCQVSA